MKQKQREAREGKDVREGRVRSGILCLECVHGIGGVEVELWNLGLDRVRVMPGLTSSHGTSLDCAPMSRRIDTR